ncbi:hypothetical protein HYV31_00380 [candidate division WWE3 bacterium]|nr:hypothetical protein [candidate division WWE3 bacterium]
MSTHAFSVQGNGSSRGLQIVYTVEKAGKLVTLRLSNRFLPGHGFQDAFPETVVTKTTEGEALKTFKTLIDTHLRSVGWI